MAIAYTYIPFGKFFRGFRWGNVRKIETHRWDAFADTFVLGDAIDRCAAVFEYTKHLERKYFFVGADCRQGELQLVSPDSQCSFCQASANRLQVADGGVHSRHVLIYKSTRFDLSGR